MGTCLLAAGAFHEQYGLLRICAHDRRDGSMLRNLICNVLPGAVLNFVLLILLLLLLFSL
jgi:hypothetical protein